MGCPSRLQVNQINTDNEINNAYCLRMPRLDDLTDVCKDGNLLKVNSCNCAAELDEAKEGVSTASIIIRRKKSLKREKEREGKNTTSHFKGTVQNKHLFYGCVSFRPKFRTAVMVNMSDWRLAVCGCGRFFFFFFFSGLFIYPPPPPPTRPSLHGPLGCKHSLCSNQSRQCRFNLKMRRNTEPKCTCHC